MKLDKNAIFLKHASRKLIALPEGLTQNEKGTCTLTYIMQNPFFCRLLFVP